LLAFSVVTAMLAFGTFAPDIDEAPIHHARITSGSSLPNVSRLQCLRARTRARPLPART
jgi:hypothetical protein